MTPENLPQQLLGQFKLPPQDLANLSFCKGNRPAAVKSWAEALPATRVNRTSVLLYKAVPEICRLKASTDHRLEMLEAIRPYVQQCIQGLAKHFLNQPLILPEAPLKTAIIAQALQRHMTIGYSAVVAELAAKIKKNKAADPKLGLACHRAITGFGLLLLRGYQLYSQIPAKLWLELHSLYRLAEHWDLLDQAVSDPLLHNLKSCSVAQAYTRILLLACARPNQMRQTDVAATYDALEDWVHLAKVRSVDQQPSNNLFLINLSADMAPLYKSRFSGSSRDVIRELDMSPLLTAFRRQREMGAGGSAITIPHTISTALADHLQQAWGVSQERSFDRQPSKNSVEVCVGLSNLHHQVTNGMSFEEFIGQSVDEEIDLGALSSDPWATSFTRDSTADQRDDYPLFSVRIVDSSPGGYCLEWRDRIPANVKAGEVLGLREQGRHRWGLAVIRWVEQQRNATRLGVQLLGLKATPYGAAIEQPNGDYSDYRRVLMLPELKAANQPATLLTAFAPFQEANRLILNRHGNNEPVQLSRRIFSTGSVSQFTFRSLEVAAPESGEAADEDFSSAWDRQ